MTIGFLLPFRYDTLVWRTDGRTNGRRTMAIISTTLCITSRGKNVSSLHIPLLFYMQTVSGKAKAIRKFVIRCNFKQLFCLRCARTRSAVGSYDGTTPIYYARSTPPYVTDLRLWVTHVTVIENFTFTVRSQTKNMKLSWCWQTCATRLEVSQGDETQYHFIC